MSLKEVCDQCGFPIDLPRTPVFLENDVFSITNYEINKCEGCGHQADGSTIKQITELISKRVTPHTNERKTLIKFFRIFHDMNAEEKQEVCVTLPRFCNPNYMSKGNDQEDDTEEPYSWNVTFNEIIHDTQLSRTMLKNIELKEEDLECSRPTNWKETAR